MMRTQLLTAGLVLMTSTTSLMAGDFASKADITAAMSDHTYLGGMLTGTFSEYYAADGTIKGDGYGGKWKATDHGMCFQYGTDPENCWNLKINGDAVTLYKDGAVDGSGVVVNGNPNHY